MPVPAEVLIQIIEKLINSNMEVVNSNEILCSKIDELNEKIQYAMNEAHNAYNKAQVFHGIGNLANNFFKGKGNA